MKCGPPALFAAAQEMSRDASDEAPFSGLAFKIMTDPFVGSLTFVRVYSGVLEVRRAAGLGWSIGCRAWRDWPAGLPTLPGIRSAELLCPPTSPSPPRYPKAHTHPPAHPPHTTPYPTPRSPAPAP